MYKPLDISIHTTPEHSLLQRLDSFPNSQVSCVQRTVQLFHQKVAQAMSFWDNKLQHISFTNSIYQLNAMYSPHSVLCINTSRSCPQVFHYLICGIALSCTDSFQPCGFYHHGLNFRTWSCSEDKLVSMYLGLPHS